LSRFQDPTNAAVNLSASLATAESSSSAAAGGVVTIGGTGTISKSTGHHHSHHHSHHSHAYNMLQAEHQRIYDMTREKARLLQQQYLLLLYTEHQHNQHQHPQNQHPHHSHQQHPDSHHTHAKNNPNTSNKRGSMMISSSTADSHNQQQTNTHASTGDKTALIVDGSFPQLTAETAAALIAKNPHAALLKKKHRRARQSKFKDPMLKEEEEEMETAQQKREKDQYKKDVLFIRYVYNMTSMRYIVQPSQLRGFRQWIIRRRAFQRIAKMLNSWCDDNYECLNVQDFMGKK
jgi:hypothetical protein